MAIQHKSWGIYLYTCIISMLLFFCAESCWATVWVSEGVEDFDNNTLWHSLQNFNPPEKNIVVTVTARNVKDWYERNLGSIVGQKYTNYRIIYVDDCSTDGTPALVERFIQQASQAHRVTLIKNNEWRSQLANHYLISHMCNDNEIIVNVDGDDWLKHEYVLSLINKVYSINQDIWVTYGGSQFYPSNQRPTQFLTREIIQANTYRETRWSSWAWWHPRTYYAWLFKRIRLRDLLLNSSFKPLAPSPDSAFMYPILEMSGRHTYRIPDDLYKWNLQNPLSQWVLSGSNKQREIDAIIGGWQKYQPLVAPVFSPVNSYNNCKADLIIFNIPKVVLNNALSKIVEKIKGLHKIYILHQSITEQDSRFYRSLKHKFPQIEPVYIGKITVKQALINVLTNAREHIIFAHSMQIPMRKRDISVYIRELERTFAAGFYIGLSGQKERTRYIPEYAPLSNTIGAWQFKDGKAAGSSMFSLNWVLYRKHTVLDKINALSFASYKDFERAWYNLNNNTQLVDRSVGLFALE